MAGLVAGWLALALEALAQAGAGGLLGVGSPAVRMEPPFVLPSLVLGPGAAGTQGPWGWAATLLAGPGVALLAGSLAHLLAEGLQAAAWLRVVAFEAFAFAWLRLPLLVLSAGIPGGRGSLAGLYERLGEPESGRWAAVALGLVILWGAARLVSWRAVEVARQWLRADGRVFRRRAVLLLAGYPFVLATAAFALERPTAPLAWLVAALGLVLGCLVARTN